jgi:hypothetical protein
MAGSGLDVTTPQDIYRRDLEYDYEAAEIRFKETELRYRQYIWMLTMACGGEIRVPKSVIRDVGDPGDLTVTTDRVTGEMIFTASLYDEGVTGL